MLKMPFCKGAIGHRTCQMSTDGWWTPQMRQFAAGHCVSTLSCQKTPRPGLSQERREKYSFWTCGALEPKRQPGLVRPHLTSPTRQLGYRRPPAFPLFPIPFSPATAVHSIVRRRAAVQSIEPRRLYLEPKASSAMWS